MRRLLLLALLHTITVSAFGQSTSSLSADQQRIAAVRTLVTASPASNQIVTNRLYRDSVRLKDLQQMSGTLITQSKLPGTNAAITEKGVTLNVGSNLFALRNVRRFSVQGILLGQAEEGFVKTFSKGAYQRTLGGGISANMFVFGLSDTTTFYHYETKNKQRLHQQLREELVYHTVTSKPADNPSVTGALAKLCSLKLTEILPLVRGTNGPLDMSQQVEERRRYLEAIGVLQPLLPTAWYQLSPDEAAKWLQDSLCNPSNFTQRYQALHDKHTADRLDSIQQAKAKWTRRGLLWVNLKAVINNEQQPIYDGQALLLMRKEHFNFVDVRTSLNGAVITKKTRHFGALGVGFTNQRTFDTDDQVTYQRSTTAQPPGSAPVTVIETAKFYPNPPPRPAFGVLDAQYTFFWQKARVGFDGSYKYKLGFNATDQNAATLGVFVPVLVGESAINFMLQTKWSSTTNWTIGFNLAASLPGFLTK